MASELPTTNTDTKTSTTPSPPLSTSKETSTISRYHLYLNKKIDTTHSDIPILACCFVSGLCDSSAYNAWTCFVSMQTGNTVFLALGASQQPLNKPYGWLKSLISISSFLLGCYLWSLTRYIGPLTRRTLTLSFLLQSCCILTAAALVQSSVVSESSTSNNQPESDTTLFYPLLPLFMLALQSGGQIMTSRLLGLNEIPTTVLTSVYCDLASDRQLFARPTANIKRNRRAASVLLFLIGGIVGGWLGRSKSGMAGALWVAGAVKFGISVGWASWKEEIAVDV